MEARFAEALLIITLQLFTASAFAPKISIEPKYAHVNASEEVTILCRARDNQSLTACQFNVDSKEIDLSLGLKESPSGNHTYFGTGLENGECGIRIKKGFEGNGQGHQVGCRVRGRTGGWVYEEMNVYVDVHSRVYFTSSPDDPVLVHPGEKCHLLFTLTNMTVHPLGRCYFDPPGDHVFSAVHFSNVVGRTQPATRDYAYYGAGLQYGECGIALHNVTDEYNGRWSVLMEYNAPYNGVVFTSKTLIVYKHPREIVLETLTPNDYLDGDDMSARCRALESRPVANITWLLDGVVMRQDQDDEHPVEARWRWRHDLQSVSQTITRRLSLPDNGRVVTCRVQHGATSTDKHLVIRVKLVHTPHPTTMWGVLPDKSGNITAIVVATTGAILLVIAVVMSLNYARRSRRWCFRPAHDGRCTFAMSDGVAQSNA